MKLRTLLQAAALVGAAAVPRVAVAESAPRTAVTGFSRINSEHPGQEHHCRSCKLSARRQDAAAPPRAFVPLERQNHLLLQSEPAWEVFISKVRAFLGSGLVVTGLRGTAPMQRQLVM